MNDAAPRSSRLLLVSYDDLVLIWDGLTRLVQEGDIGDPSWPELKRLRERVAELLD